MNPTALLPFVIPLLLIAILIAASKHNQKHVTDTDAPEMQIWARLVRFEPPAGETCSIVFEDAACTKFRLNAPASVMDTMQENSIGSLCYQGNGFISFTAFS